MGDGGKSIRHRLEPSTDSQEGVGRIKSCRRGLNQLKTVARAFLAIACPFSAMILLLNKILTRSPS